MAAATLVWMIGIKSVRGLVNNKYTFLSRHEVNFRGVEILLSMVLPSIIAQQFELYFDWICAVKLLSVFHIMLQHTRRCDLWSCFRLSCGSSEVCMKSCNGLCTSIMTIRLVFEAIRIDM